MPAAANLTSGQNCIFNWKTFKQFQINNQRTKPQCRISNDNGKILLDGYYQQNNFMICPVYFRKMKYDKCSKSKFNYLSYQQKFNIKFPENSPASSPVCINQIFNGKKTHLSYKGHYAMLSPEPEGLFPLYDGLPMMTC